MDIDTGPLKASTLGSSSAFKVSNAQSSGGLARYHSAPSSVLASLLDDDFYPASDNLEYARLLNEGIQSFSPLLETKGSPQTDMSPPALTALPKEEDVYTRASTVKDTQKKYLVPVGAFHEHLSQIPLSSISEHPVEETVDMCSHNQVSTPTGAPRHQFHEWSVDGPSHSALNSEFPISSFQQCNTSLIRESSLPPNNLSRAARDGECLSEVQHIATFKQVPSPRMLTPLLRQSSSPAGLLSQVNLEDFTTPGVSSPAAFLERSRKLSGKGNGIGAWADGTPELAMQHLTALNQRKRWRNIEEKLSLDMQGNGELANALPSPEGYPEDSVLCKARAKRGFATHPRSIAERQRRIKISERMKKLQDLVPNLDKQASTAEMLDEVVEYVKLLQKQVQELSVSCPSCTGACQQKVNSSP